MRAHEIMESRTMRLDAPDGREMRVYLSPSPEQLKGLYAQHGWLRGIIHEEYRETIWWPASAGLHIHVAQALGIPGGSSADEDRVLKLFMQDRKEDFSYIACHESQRQHPHIVRAEQAGIPIKTFKR